MTIPVALKEVTFWNNLKKKMVVENGRYAVEVGGSSADLPCRTEIAVSGEWKAALSNVYAIADKYCMNVGEESQIKPSITLEDATHLCPWENRPAFASSDEAVATVDGNGKVVAKGTGAATITVSFPYDGVTKCAKVPVAVR